jgi:tetratricopeptide (TPR) repeat protein
VAIVGFESENENLSAYLMEELTGALVNAGIEVADRNNLPYVYERLYLQDSEALSDQSAQAIGKFVAAQRVITGQLINMGDRYQYRVNAIHVERAARDSAANVFVRNDQEMQSMVAEQQTAAPVASRYGVTEQTVPTTPGKFLDRGIMFSMRAREEDGKAIADYTQAIALDPKNANAYIHRGFAYYSKGQKNLAIEDLETALGLDPNNQTIKNNLKKVRGR